jgi:hypothetical protein
VYDISVLSLEVTPLEDSKKLEHSNGSNKYARWKMKDDNHHSHRRGNLKSYMENERYTKKILHTKKYGRTRHGRRVFRTYSEENRRQNEAKW